MTEAILLGEDIHRHATEDAGDASEVPIDDALAQPDGFERLRSGVGRDRGYTHLGHRLEQALSEGVDDVRDRLLGSDTIDAALPNEQLGGLHREVRVHRERSEPDECGDVMYLAYVARFDDERNLHSTTRLNEVLIDGADHEKRRDGSEHVRGIAITEHDETHAIVECGIDLSTHLRESLLETLRALGDPVQALDNPGDRSTVLFEVDNLR